jgi:ribulose-5-phosphate 4-epimerase/fuculose-1-phosphate aldolase
MSSFPDPTVGLPPAATLALLARALCREGYDDHISGHISLRLADGTFAFTPRLFSWEEITADDVVRIDADGGVVDGRWTATVASAMHLAVFEARADVQVVIHAHPRFATLWAGAIELPEVYDQSAALGLPDHEVGLLERFEHVEDPVNARQAAQALGSASVLLLANHGVLVAGPTVVEAHGRAVTFEHRCRTAWEHRTAGTGHPITGPIRDQLGATWPYRDGSLFAAMARRELRLDPCVLGRAGTDAAAAPAARSLHEEH